VSETLQVWLFAGGFGLIAILFSLQWVHVKHCKAVGEAIVRLDQSLKDIKELLVPELDKQRERSHSNQNGIAILSGRVSVLEERTK
jgi:hypothetical protein